MMKKIFLICCLFSLPLFASDEQLDEIINLLKYQYFVRDPDSDPWEPGTEYYYTMSDFLQQKKKTSPFVEEYFLGTDGGRGASYSNFFDFLFSKGISDFDSFLSIPSDQQQKLYFEFYQNEVCNLFTNDFYDYYNYGGGKGFFNPLLMANMALSKLAISGGSSGGSGDLGTDSQGRNLLQAIESIDTNISAIDSALNYTKVNSKNMPILDTSSFASWMFSSVENASLYSTNKPAAFVAALKSIFDYRLNNFGNDYIGEITPDFFAGYLDVLNAQDRLNGGGGVGGGFGGSDDQAFKRSVTNSLTNISTNSNSIVDVLKKILEQVAKTQTNNQNIADSVYWMTNNFPDQVGGVLPPGSGGGGSNDVWHVWDVFASSSRNAIKVPKIVWDEIEVDGERVLFPRYDDLKFQPSDDYNRYWQEYQNLLSEAKAGNISGQEFLTGIQIFSMRFLGDISTQLMILSRQLPSKTNLWQDIDHLVDNVIPQEISSLEYQIEGQRSNIEQLNKSDSVLGIIPAVQQIKSKIELLKHNSGDSVLRLPVPAVMRSKVDYWEVDPNSINGSAQLRTFFIWVCSVIYTIIFVRTFIVPIMILVCLGIRLIDHSLGLLFFDDTQACKVVGNWTAAAFDLFCHLIGLDTNFKKWAVGIDVNED